MYPDKADTDWIPSDRYRMPFYLLQVKLPGSALQ
jgi:hypothetical protein